MGGKSNQSSASKELDKKPMIENFNMDLFKQIWYKHLVDLNYSATSKVDNM